MLGEKEEIFITADGDGFGLGGSDVNLERRM
jgi:hypothetical protein